MYTLGKNFTPTVKETLRISYGNVSFLFNTNGTSWRSWSVGRCPSQNSPWERILPVFLLQFPNIFTQGSGLWTIFILNRSLVTIVSILEIHSLSSVKLVWQSWAGYFTLINSIFGFALSRQWTVFLHWRPATAPWFFS